MLRATEAGGAAPASWGSGGKPHTLLLRVAAMAEQEAWLQCHGCGHGEGGHLVYPRSGLVPYATQVPSLAVANAVDTLFVSTAAGMSCAALQHRVRNSPGCRRAGIYVARASATVSRAKDAHGEETTPCIQPLATIDAPSTARLLLAANQSKLVVVAGRRVQFFDVSRLARSVCAAPAFWRASLAPS